VWPNVLWKKSQKLFCQIIAQNGALLSKIFLPEETIVKDKKKPKFWAYYGELWAFFFRNKCAQRQKTLAKWQNYPTQVTLPPNHWPSNCRLNVKKCRRRLAGQNFLGKFLASNFSQIFIPKQ
jgi:hypothetical protein